MSEGKAINVPSKDFISRQTAIDAMRAYMEDDLTSTGAAVGASYCIDIVAELPSAQPERLTDDDFETIRIHLNAYKEGLWNQGRWEEAEDYQRIIDRFMSFASAAERRSNG